MGTPENYHLKGYVDHSLPKPRRHSDTRHYPDYNQRVAYLLYMQPLTTAVAGNRWFSQRHLMSDVIT